MTLSEIVREVLEQHLGCTLTSEQELGPANQADFVGRSQWAGDVRVEIERRREDPVNNVVNAWRQAETEAYAAAFTLVQVFSGYYLQRPSKRLNAEFVGDKLREWGRSGPSVGYVSLAFDFEPIAHAPNLQVPADTAEQVRTQLRAQLEARMPKNGAPPEK